MGVIKASLLLQGWIILNINIWNPCHSQTSQNINVCKFGELT